MIKSVIADAQQLEAEALTAEEDAQKAYEDFGKETNDNIDIMTKDMTNKKETLAKTKVDKVESETERDEVVTELEGLASAAADLHGDCDYILKNFEIKQATRDDEIGSL